jgi:hypothetical protein
VVAIPTHQEAVTMGGEASLAVAEVAEVAGGSEALAEAASVAVAPVAIGKFKPRTMNKQIQPG